MKIIRLSFVALFIGAYGITAPLLAQVEKKVIATFSQGETLVYGENCFRLDISPESISFVTVVGSGSNKEYYCYGKDGKKTGPVKQPDIKYWIECSENVTKDCVPSYASDLSAVEKYFDWQDGTINFQGKKFGPFGQLILFNLSVDQQHFYAVALNSEMKLHYFDNTGRNLDISGMPEGMLVSPDGTRSYLKVNGTLNPYDPEALTKMIENPEEMNNPKVFLIGIDGSKYGPYNSSDFHRTWFTESGKWIIYNEKEILVDGKPLLKLDDYISPCDIWISNSGTDYAWANYQNLFFKDGSKYPAPISIEFINSKGTGTLKWLSLENGNTFVLYKKTF